MESLLKYTVYRSNRTDIRIVLRSNGTLAVYCPQRCPKREIEKAVAKNYCQLAKKHNSKADALFATENGTETLPYLGKRFPIEYAETTMFSFSGESFTAPSGSTHEAIRTAYIELMRRIAKKHLAPTVAALAEKHGFKFTAVRIKATCSRFGSCSSKGNINLSLALMACDYEFIEYVILHELCHTVHMNHSKDFYSLLSKVCPRHKEISDRGKAKYSDMVRAITYRPCP